MADQTAFRQQVREYTWAWWLLLLVGLIGIAAGVVVLAKPGNSLAALAVISGCFLLVDGIFEVLYSLSRTASSRGLVALLGVVSVILGVLLIRHPIKGVTAVALLIGIWLIAIGTVRFVAAFEVREHRVWNLLAAAIEVVAGIVIVSDPRVGYATLAILVGISFIANGIGMVALGWLMHGVRREVADTTHHHPGAAPA